ncbi:MAG: 4'-phosphopantetheinyl transferase superfamily protein [Lachnospiraceae bacterium]|nr:4'-phosphopantetheinyl transferase superfamily protein [Lachnospiraceae bacterium]
MQNVGSIQIWTYDTAGLSKADEALVAEKWPKRFLKANRFRSEEARRQCIGAGVLLAAAGFSEERYFVSERGKPFIENGPAISITHSGHLVLLAVSRDETVGADLEILKEKDVRVFDRILQAEEAEWIGSDPARFLSVFTAKESVMKALGTGFATPPSSFSVYGSFAGSPVEAENARFFVKTFQYEDAVVSVASGSEIREITLYTAR